MKIVVVGSGCSSCNLLFEQVKKITKENSIKAEIEYLADVDELIKLGVMSSPALVIDGKVAFTGMAPASVIRETILRASGKIEKVK